MNHESIVNLFHFKMTDKDSTSCFLISKALAIKRGNFNIPSQFLPKGFQPKEEWA